jgi:spore coat protein U-like protein
MRKILAATLAGSVLLASVNADAANPATTTLSVSATVLKVCTVAAAALNFGNYTPGTGPVSVSTPINVKCTNTTPFTVALDKGTTAGATFAQRLMVNGSATLQYNLFTTSGGATIFGDGTSSTSTMGGTGAGLGTAVAITVYGVLPDSTANQAVAPAVYTDTVNVSVSY